MKFTGAKQVIGLIFYKLRLGEYFQRLRKITCVNLAITTICNRSCPNCCCDIPRIKQHWNADLDYLNRAAQCFKNIDRIKLTGGEPSLHPQFEELVPKLKKLFQCQHLTIETNGARFRQIPYVFEHFDEIIVTHYSPPEFIEDNGEEILFLQEYLRPKGIKVQMIDIHHIPRTHRGNQPCSRGFSETVSCFQGRIYSCCMGWGIDGAPSVPMKTGWRDALPTIPLPCSSCFFAEEKFVRRAMRWLRQRS